MSLSNFLNTNENAKNYFLSLPWDTRLELIRSSKYISSQQQLEEAVNQIFHRGGTTHY